MTDGRSTQNGPEKTSLLTKIEAGLLLAATVWSLVRAVKAIF